MVQNGPEWSKMVKKGQHGKKKSKWPKMVKIAKNGQNGLKSSKIVQNGPKWSKMVKNSQNGLKWSKMVKMVQHGGPDLKRAQRPSLSARRAGRTKSRGPKGPS